MTADRTDTDGIVNSLPPTVTPPHPPPYFTPTPTPQLPITAAGQLGHGDDQDRWAPEPVLRLHTSRHRYLDLRAPHVKSRPWRVLAAAAGRNHSAAVVELPLDVRDLAD